ncbi:MAG: META domain-containing protein [Bacteroidetes bacterium]|nr:META domain-containing protein [Bacteroidota bacterium]
MKLINLFLITIKNDLAFSFVIPALFLCSNVLSQSTKPKNEVSYNLGATFIGGQKNMAVKDKASLVFYTKSKTAKCFTKCNFINLKYSEKKAKFKFTKVTPGDVPCPDHLIGIESDLKENFLKITNYLITNNKIYFFNKKGTLLIFYEQ